jgi:hypothetical protein
LHDKFFAGFRLGRSEGEIIIPDAKISSLHAEVHKDPKGNLILVDLGSSNGLYLDGARVKRISLMPGVKFRAGKTIFKTVEVDGEKSLRRRQGPSWRDVLIDELPLLDLKNLPTKDVAKAFSPYLKITVLTGVQTDQTFVLGFGPRSFGSSGLDFELFDPEAPELAFQIHPDPGGARFTTEHPEQVLLNHNSISSDLLRAGDRIYLGETILQISFEE